MELVPRCTLQGCTTCGSLAAGPWKWRENEKMERKWRENEKLEKYSLSTFPHFLFISSLSIHFLYTKLSHFVAKCYCECHKKMRYEKIILGRIHWEKVPQVVRACPYLWIYRRFLMNVKAPVGADKQGKGGVGNLMWDLYGGSGTKGQSGLKEGPTWGNSCSTILRHSQYLNNGVFSLSLI